MGKYNKPIAGLYSGIFSIVFYKKRDTQIKINDQFLSQTNLTSQHFYAFTLTETYVYLKVERK